MTRAHDQHDLRDRAAKALEGTGSGVLVGYFPGYDEPVEPARAPPKPALPGVWRIERWQDEGGVWTAQAWRNGVCMGKGSGMDALAAAQRARRSAKHRAAADWAWRFGEACVLAALSSNRRAGWSNR